MSLKLAAQIQAWVAVVLSVIACGLMAISGEAGYWWLFALNGFLFLAALSLAYQYFKAVDLIGDIEK